MSLQDRSCVVAMARHGQRQDFKFLPLSFQALAFKFLSVTWWQRHCNILVSPKKKKRFFEMCLPTTPPTPPILITHFTPPYLRSLAGSLTSSLLFFSFSLIHSFLLLYPLSLVLPHHYHHHFHHHFQTRSRENS